ncbi:MAG: phosphoribosylanthranilate isomerase [bacterium]
MLKIKICGITNKEDALNAIALGASSLGFNFHKDSPRYITPEKVAEITYFLPPFVQLVAVFVNESIDSIHKIMQKCGLDLVQLHGDESLSFCKSLHYRFIKAIRVKDESDLSDILPFQGFASGILLDTKVSGSYGGTGKTFDWGLAIKATELDLPIILSGGIKHTNIKKAMSLVNPYAVDLCSSVEIKPGIKDYNKLSEFFRLVY